MNDDSQQINISVESLRNRITRRLIPLLFIGLLINMILSLARIPTMGFRPFMVLHIIFLGASALLYLSRKSIRPETSAFAMIGILFSLFLAGVASLGLLSVAFVLAPMIALYLMLLGHQKIAYTSIVVILIYILAMGICFVTGFLESPAVPNIYARSSSAWLLMFLVVGWVSVAFVSPFKLVSEALEGSEERFRLAFENANIGICLTSLEGRFLKVNDAMCEMVGYTRDELGQKSFNDLTHPDDRAAGQNFIEHAPADVQSNIVFEKRYIHKHGNVIWVKIASSLIRDSQHNSDYFITHIQNITERKHAEEHVKKLATELQVTLDTVNVGIAHIKNRRVEWTNAAHDAMLGYPAGATLGMETSSFFTERADYDRLGQDAYPHLATGESFNSEMEMRKKDGTHFWCSLTGRSVNPSDSSAGSIWMLQDIAERRRAEVALRSSEAKLRAVLTNSKDAIGVHLDGIWEMCNPAAIRLFGVSSEADLIGKSILAVIAPSERSRIREFVNQRTDGVIAPTDYVTRGLKSDGSEFDLDVALSSFNLENEVYVLVILRDITERKQAEAALRRSESRFRTFIEDAPVAISVSRNGVGLYGNHKLAQIIGMKSIDELAGRPIIDYFAPQAKEESKERSRRRSLGRPVPSEYESVALRTDGTQIPIHLAIAPVELDDGTASIAFVTDITERKLNEEKLKSSEERFRKLFEDSPIGIAFLGTEREIFFTNKCYRDFLGYDDNEIKELGPVKLIHPDDWDASMALSIKLRSGQIPLFRMEQRVHQKGRSGCLVRYSYRRRS